MQYNSPFTGAAHTTSSRIQQQKERHGIDLSSIRLNRLPADLLLCGATITFGDVDISSLDCASCLHHPKLDFRSSPAELFLLLSTQLQQLAHYMVSSSGVRSVVNYVGVRISQVKPSNCFRHLKKISFVFHFWHKSFILDDVKLAVIQQQFWMKEGDIFRGFSTYSDPSYIFSGGQEP